ncbi:conserved hypothetical protein [Treponema primitia ZAS-2]|uniref:DUF3990 domain-containing protein n=1 Tax=Treponema primitia (strain ATCC BAA-887 / DSM 12427 / ZAS-2) TaxID=545694 RepID=F5YM88_TREPZ|nr:DUF3990 domain-containing protein [Treponema primitia]AEF84079.1 conserved hypothetical protein [Treponema primitia ZAS-2]
MKLFHGSNQDFDTVDLSKSRDKRDFGRGFYMTTIREQAGSWAENMVIRYGGAGIFVYEFELSISDNLKIKHFDGLTEEWLELVKTNRIKGGLQHQYDIVQGPVANDNTMRTIALYVAGIYTADMALRQLQFFKVNDQVSIHTQQALSCLCLTKKDNHGK